MSEEIYIDPIVKQLLEKVQRKVTQKDFDWVNLIDGVEGSGKSVLGLQLASYLDPNFSMDNVVFNAKDFINKLKTAKKFSCILIDEAFNAMNSRAAMSEVNRSIIGVATEMRQRNLYVIIILPSIFDLDKYFAIHRCSSLLHCYLKDDEDRGQYIIFPRDEKKLLYINGRKKYDYSYPHSPYPPCRFFKGYPIDEQEYRAKKSKSFVSRSVSPRAQKWMAQRNGYIKYLYHEVKLSQEDIANILTKYKAEPIEQTAISAILIDKEIQEGDG